MGIIEGLIIAGVTGIISSIGTIAAIRTEISWLKSTIVKIENRLDNHSNRINMVERYTK